MQAQSKLIVLPQELLSRIFDFVYPPWSLEIELRENALYEAYHKNAILRAVPAPPSAALLATCKAMHEIAAHARWTAFTGVVSSRDAPQLGILEHILVSPRWKRIESRVKHLRLPNRTYVLKVSQNFITLLPALETIELFEVLGFHAALTGEITQDSDDDMPAVSSIYFENQAVPFVPRVPDTLPLICNGGTVDLLIHVHFDVRRPDRHRLVIDILLRVASDGSLHLVDKMWIPHIIRNHT